MNQIDIDKAFVSEYDTFLFEFDASHPMTASQLKEVEKYKKVARIRDQKNKKISQSEIWKDF